jgi:hypothetical protein
MFLTNESAMLVLLLAIGLSSVLVFLSFLRPQWSWKRTGAFSRRGIKQ